MTIDDINDLNRIRGELGALAVMVAQCTGLDGEALNGLATLLTGLADGLDRIALDLTNPDE